MVEKEEVRSILVVDCGTVTTQAMLLDRVASQYRFVARGEASTTTGYPWADITTGIRHAIEQITAVTGRRFFDSSENLISPEREGREGVDVFAVTVSAGQPLQVVLGGLVENLSVASARRAAAGTYAQIQAILSGQPDQVSNDEAQVRIIREAAPDVVLIAGGVEGGATSPVRALVESATLGCSMMDGQTPPHIVYAGNSKLRQGVVKTVGDEIAVRVVDNVRPTLSQENLADAQKAMEEIYLQRKMRQLPGVETVKGWSPMPIIPTARAFGRLIEYLWHLGDPSTGVLGVDVGAGNTTLAAVFDEQLFMTIHSELGSAFGGAELMREHGRRRITRWLPEPIDGQEAMGILIDKEIHPCTIPQRSRELWVEQAVAREAIRSTLKIARPGWKPGAARPYPHLMPLCDTILLSGGVLTQAPRPGQAALIVLDALEPIGVSTLVLDSHGLGAALGNAAAVKPLAAVETLDSGGFTNLATVVTPIGDARPGDTILKVKVTYEDESAFEVEVTYGNLEILPLPQGKQAELELRPQRHIDVGMGPGKGGKRRVNGGLVGLIIDARGRPLQLAREPKQRQEQIQQWLWDVGG
jgi:hypothetical protein